MIIRNTAIVLAVVLLLTIPALAEPQNVKEYLETQVPVIHINSIGADSSGMTLFLEPYMSTRTRYQPSIIDINYTLMDGETAVYSKTSRQVTLVQATRFHQPWQVNLENDRQYTARADIYMYADGSPQLVKSSVSGFTARMDAHIIDVYSDSKGASATIHAASMVPLDADMIFSLVREGTVLETQTVRTPRMTSNSDEETVNVLWDSVLLPGTYEIQVRLNDRDRVIDRFDDTFQSEMEPSTQQDPDPPAPQTPGFTGLTVIIAVLVTLILLRKGVNRGR